MYQGPTSAGEDEPVSTMPDGVRVTTHGINAPEIEPFIAETIRATVQVMGRRLDLCTLDGVTIALDHGAAALELDRGIEGLRPPRVTSDNAVGVAKTVTVIRQGRLKSHIFLGVATLMPLFRENEDRGGAYHVIAHECAHVDVTAAFERCFPGHLIEQAPAVLSEIRWDFALGCWDEYKVTQMCARCGADQTETYETLFLDALAYFPPKAEEALRAFDTHGDLLVALAAVLHDYGLVMQRAAYHLGNLDGHGKSVDDLPRTQHALDGHWMGPYIRRLHQALRDVNKGYGTWPDDSSFMALATVQESMLRDQGVRYEQRAHRELRIDLSGAMDRVRQSANWTGRHAGPASKRPQDKHK